jgi:hypothetical protein
MFDYQDTSTQRKVNSSKVFDLHAPQCLWDELTRVAAATGQSKSALIRLAIARTICEFDSKAAMEGGEVR